MAILSSANALLTATASGAIALHDLLRCRIRYFTDGGIIGSRTFVQEQFARFKRWVNPPKTKRGYLFLTEGERQIWILRNLRLGPIG